MKIIKRFIHLLLVLLLIFPLFLMTSNVKSDDGTTDLYINGRRITLKNGQGVKISTEYNLKGQEFRACWVSALVSDIAGFSTISGYKQQIISVLDNMEKQNLNTIIFHIRMKNDACYESAYNKWSSYYNTDPIWDSLPWVIEECHRRGIEFHAWMNPYRVSTSSSSDLVALSKNFLPSNPASNPDNLLNCSSCVILNPGIPEVQDFLVTTCMEVVEKYNVDAIHFDDYFYASGCDDSATIRKYNTTGLSEANFRRKQVDDFIEKLSKRLRKFNEETGRRVQLGISPTGVYANGTGNVSFDSNGNVSSTGSQTGGYAHYGSPLYADTLKWINNEWIDYICPQTYHAITNGAVPFCEITNWWNKVMARTNVNLYVSMGLYMRGGSGNASWSSNELEPYHQIMYTNTLENVRGMSVYSYSALSSLNSSTIKNVWSTPVIPPVVRTMDEIIIDGILSLDVKKTSFGNLIEFPKNDDAKFYVIYRSEMPITYDASEVIDVIGDISVDGVISYPDEVSDKFYYYGVKCLSNSNTLSEGMMKTNSEVDLDKKAKLEEVPNFKVSDNLLSGEVITATWDKVLYQLGKDIDYKLEYSFDNGDIYNSKVENYRGMYQSKIRIPEGVKIIDIAVTAENKLAKSVKTYHYDISKNLGHIYNFGVIDSTYSNKDTIFYFNRLDNSNSEYEYTLQLSYDGLNFEDVKTIKSSDAFNQQISSIIEPYQNTIFYRIKASYNGSYGFSDVVSYNCMEYLNNDITSTINEGVVLDEYIFNEGDSIKIKLTNSNDVQYSISFSQNNISWLNITNYDQRVKREVIDGYYVVSFNASYQFFKAYIKVMVISNGKEAEVLNTELYVRLSFLYSDEVLDYLFNEVKNDVNILDIYR